MFSTPIAYHVMQEAYLFSSRLLPRRAKHISHLLYQLEYISGLFLWQFRKVFAINVTKQEISRSIHFCLHPRAESFMIEVKLTRLLPKGLVCLAFLSDAEILHGTQQKVDFLQRRYIKVFFPWTKHSVLWDFVSGVQSKAATPQYEKACIVCHVAVLFSQHTWDRRTTDILPRTPSSKTWTLF